MSTNDDGDRRVVDPSTLRRAPRYGRFAFAGSLLGALAALVLAVLPTWESAMSRGTLFFFLLLALGGLGALLGMVVAVAADRRSVRRRGAHTPRRRGARTPRRP